MSNIKLRPTMEDSRAAYEEIAHSTIDIFNKDGGIDPQMFVFELNPHIEGKFKQISIVSPELVKQLHTSAESKGMIPHLMTGIFAQLSGPALIVSVTEAWMSTAVADPVHGFVKDPASRQEVIIVCVHSLIGSKIGILPISSEPTRHAKYQPLSDQTVGGKIAMASLDEDESEHSPTPH